MKKIITIFSFLVLGLLLCVPVNASAASDTSPTFVSDSNNSDFISIKPTNNLKQKAPPASDEQIKLSKFKKNLLQNNTATLAIMNLAPNSKVSFSSSNESVLSVTQTSNTTCEYTGVGYGSAKILIRITTPGFLFFDSKEDIEAKINVTPRAISVVFRRLTRSIAVGQNIKLGYTLRPSISKEKPVFSSLRKKIASVNGKGNVKGRKPGTTYIYATLENGKSAKCKIIVKKKNLEQ